MKKLAGVFLFMLFIGFSTVTHAQEKSKTVGKEIKEGAKKVGNKTAEVASKGSSKLVDQQLKDKTAPNGEVVYVNGHSQYYWVDKKGHKHFITEAQLKTKE